MFLNWLTFRLKPFPLPHYQRTWKDWADVKVFRVITQCKRATRNFIIVYRLIFMAEEPYLLNRCCARVAVYLTVLKLAIYE
jgi:hypothetical protein